MNLSKIKCSDSGLFSNIILDYINNDSFFKPLSDFSPNINCFSSVISQRNNITVNRSLLVSVINTQYSVSGAWLADKQKINIDKLQNSNTYTVTTGHQLCLFTGPLYFIYKICTVIKLAEELKNKFPENNFVPVFWMASEDHDIEEVSSVSIFGKKIDWNTNYTGPAGNMPTESLSDVFLQLKSVLGTSAKEEHIVNLFENAYLTSKNLSEATRKLLSELFGNTGLLVIDGNDKLLKSSFSSIIKEDIINRKSHELVLKTSGYISGKYKPQVNPREINFFYLSNNSRERIEYENKKYKVLNTSIEFTEQELSDEINNFPEKFSPNVVMRPVYQSFLLPDVAYVGGPAELAYWLQLKSLFDYYKIYHPVIFPRNHFFIINKSINDKLNKLNVSYSDIFKDTSELLKKSIIDNAQGDITLQKEKEAINTLFNSILKKAAAADNTLIAKSEATHKSILKMLEAEKRKNEETETAIITIKEKLFPDNKLQERTENFLSFYNSFDADFFETVLSNTTPFDFSIKILHP
jgi:bacillithiol synthase